MEIRMYTLENLQKQLEETEFELLKTKKEKRKLGFEVSFALDEVRKAEIEVRKKQAILQKLEKDYDLEQRKVKHLEDKIKFLNWTIDMGK